MSQFEKLITPTKGEAIKFLKKKLISKARLKAVPHATQSIESKLNRQ